ncbi:UNVERIFIED_ORG: hypothetical protein J2X74_003178 [Bacillus sp. 1751]|nr:hypothetical protein [Bacillus sp. 1751]
MSTIVMLLLLKVYIVAREKVSNGGIEHGRNQSKKAIY